VENCQLGVFLAYAVPGGGRALIDRELYLPQSWTGDRDRCRQAGVPDDRAFATKPELARQMIARAIDAGVPFGWVAADEAYGQNTQLRDWLEQHHVSYVLAVPKTFTVTTQARRRPASALAALVPAAGWQQLSCGDGAKGPRYYDWALIATTSPVHHLLVRRPVTGGELAFFTCHAPAGTTLAGLVRVAGARWAVEECFQAAKNETGLDHYQVRRYDAWYRHITLSMLALAFLQATAAQKGHQHLWTTFPDSGAA
jgi:SRSO17 transposase